ncbi:hypothetical protein BFW01_g10779 [Lasiodiplodia theobromae]|uniref:Uncharacterized protein n=1 Tax=Lasiodiplodia theobromae TaxID=45133 RepID=A0A8H7IQ75_9PEZI|nr:hypothetical protein BFW01_g10779 [Lasiodiplodia theobromae]
MLCSLEIADGSRSSWITHARGAAAILESYTHMIDTHVADFATRYLRPRSIFLNTTTADQQGEESSAVGRLANPLPTTHPLHIDAVATVAAIDPHIGCSLEVLDIIAQTADLASLKWSCTDQPKPSHVADPTITHRAADLLARLNSLQQPSSSTYNDNDADADYVHSCAESFRLAALIYLRHVAGFDYPDPFRSSSSSPSSSSSSSLSSSSSASARTTQLRADLRRFFTLYTTRIVRRGMPRVLFPVWPLFVAGCFAEEDAFASAAAAAAVGGDGGSVGEGGGKGEGGYYYSERAVVMDVFATLEETWPVSNVPVVRAAVETVWKERDLSVGCRRRGSGDGGVGGRVRAAAWKRAIEALGWKLALS